jgi:hypothetical protein
MGVLIQLSGVLGISVNAIIYQQRKNKKLLFYKLISDFLWFLHYLLLGAHSGALVAAIGIFREMIFINQNKKSAKGKYWLLTFIACSILTSIFSWKGLFSLLPAIASAISVISFWKSNPKLTRILALVISSCMFTYDVACGSYMGIANEILTTTSAIFGILRYDIIRKNATNNTKIY